MDGELEPPTVRTVRCGLRQIILATCSVGVLAKASPDLIAVAAVAVRDLLFPNPVADGTGTGFVTLLKCQRKRTIRVL